MDRLLRPERFDTESTVPNAEKLYRHWKMTFQNYLESSIRTPAAANPEDENAVQAAATAAATAERKKLHALFNNVSANIYETISDCTTFNQAFLSLDNTYIKPVSTLYNRHKLITNKQDVSSSIDIFVQELHRLAKPCNFTAVTAEQNRNDYIREAFISGIASASIRQRLLENATLTLEEAIRQARALEQAQTQSQHFENNIVAAAPLEQNNDDCVAVVSRHNNRNNQQQRRTNNRNFRNNNTGNTSNVGNDNSSNSNNSGGGNNSSQSCWFCGGSRHPRATCPARNAECHKCGRIGHMSRVCRSSESVTAAVVAGGGGMDNSEFSNNPDFF